MIPRNARDPLHPASVPVENPIISQKQFL